MKNPWGEHTIENVTYAVENAKRIPDKSIFSKTVLQPVFTSLANIALWEQHSYT